MSITPDQFLTQPSDPDEDALPETSFAEDAFARFRVHKGPLAFSTDRLILDGPDHLESIAKSLDTIAASFGANAELEDECNTLREEVADLHDKYAALFGLVADIEKVVAKSTSKLAKEVKASIQFWKTGAVVESELTPEIVAASALNVPTYIADDPHNHAWEPNAERILICSCGAWIDNSDPDNPQGVVREPGYESDPDA